MTDDSVAVKVHDLRKRYGGGWFGRTVDALQGVSFEVPKGQVFGLLGPNGAGKTTVIKILLGIVRPTGGGATLLGRPAGDRAGRLRVGYLPENLQIPRHQTARTAMEYYGRLSGLDNSVIRERSSELLDRVGLGGRDKESVKQFSKGMRQRLGLAQSLLHDPELLILDEPTDGLDPVGRSQVRAIMNQLAEEGRTVFVNSHLLQEVELVCDHVAIMNFGQLKFVGSVDSFDSTDAQEDLDLQLVGDQQVAEESLQAHQVKAWNRLPTGHVTAKIAIRDQAEIDHVVDALRQRGIGIAALSRNKKTLEDFFLDVVQHKGAPTQ